MDGGGDAEEQWLREAHGEGGAGKARRRTASHLPTAEEMQTLRETRELFQSNLMRLQIEELLKEVKPSERQCGSAEEALRTLKETLEGMPADDGVLLRPGLSLFNDVSSLSLRFEPPARVAVVGSFLLKSLSKPVPMVDLAVEFPVVHADFKNWRYHDKRVLYLGHLAAELEERLPEWALAWDLLDQDPCKPILVATPKKGAIAIRILPMPAAGVIAPAKLAPHRSNVRGDTVAPTPHYNAAVLRDMCLLDHLQLQYEAVSVAPSMADAAILGKVWLHQREMRGGDAFSGFLFSMLLVHLLQRGRINAQMSAYQIFRVALDYLASTDLTTSGVALDGVDGEEVRQAQDLYDVVFMAPAQGTVLNLTARMSRSSFRDLQREARLGSAYLGSGTLSNPFDAVFMTRVEFAGKFDSVCSVLEPPAVRACEELSDFGQLAWAQIVARRGAEVLEKGLDERATAVRVVVEPPESVSAKKGGLPPTLAKARLLVGVLVDPEHARRLVDAGPLADDKAASKAFRALWGDKAELRRFKDASIREAVVWDSLAGQRHAIVPAMVAHLLEKRFGGPLKTFTLATALDMAVPHAGKAEERTHAILQSLEGLSQVIQGLDNLPLAITAIQPSSAVFRHTDPRPPRPHVAGGAGQDPFEDVASNAVRPMEAVITFEAATQWPGETSALRALKTAFFLHLQTCLQSRHQIESQVTREFIDVLHEGFAFRLRIRVDKEAKLLQEAKDTEGAGELRRDAARTHLTGALRAFHLLHTAYGETVRLAKEWLNAHLFAGYIADEAVDLMVLHLFSQPQPYTPPREAVGGFYRFLRLVATFDWAGSPLIVSLDGTPATDEQREEIEQRFQQSSSSERRGVYVAVAGVGSESLWTTRQPSKAIWSRAVRLAGHSATAMGDLMRSGAPPAKFRVLFRPLLRDFDVVVRIKASAIVADSGKRTRQGTPKKKRRGSSAVVGFDPVVLFVEELRKRLGELALVFYDGLRKDKVALVWRPDAFLPAPYRVGVCGLRGEGGAGDAVLPNICEVIAEVRALGVGVVEEIEVR